MPAAAGVGLLALAAGAGVASFFSPCAFPLLLTLMARRVQGRPRAMTAALGFAGPFSAGASLSLLLLGGLIALGGGRVAESVTFTSTAGITIRTVVGLLLIFLGLIQAEVLPLSFHPVERFTRRLSQAQAGLRRERPAVGALLFGFGYLLIGFG